MHLKNLPNEYQEMLGKVFAKAPKAVIAAVAVSSLTSGGDYLAEAETRFIEEWWCLYEAKIVPQKPPYPRKPTER
jgi:hypothetical protein